MNDIFDEMTKKEIIAWIGSNVFVRRPSRSWLLGHRWDVASEKLLEDMEKERNKFVAIDFKQRDKYAAACNAATTNEEKLRYLELMTPYHEAFDEHMKAQKRLDIRQKKIDRLYEQWQLEKEKERNEFD